MKPEAPHDSTLSREQLTERAREPREHLARPGWSAWEPEGPLQEEAENTYLGAVDVADPAAYHEDPARTPGDPSGARNPVDSPLARDIRNDDDEAEELLPATEAPPSERAG